MQLYKSEIYHYWIKMVTDANLGNQKMYRVVGILSEEVPFPILLLLIPKEKEYD